MFDFVRKHNRLMQFLLLLLIFPSFVLFGIQPTGLPPDLLGTDRSPAHQDVEQSH